MLLDSAARLAAVGVDTPSRAQVAALAGRSTTSSTTDQAFGALLGSGHLAIGGTGEVRLTAAGKSAAAPVDVPPTLAEYHAQWRGLLRGSEVRLFEAMLSRGRRGAPITRSELATSAGISTTSSTTDQAMSRLIGLDVFAVAGKGEVQPGRLLFPRGLR